MAKRRRSYESYWAHYAPSTPIAVDGIKAKSQRGGFTQSWWGDRWIKALTRLMDSGRLGRGRSYARKGQVLEIAIAPGQVTARVQGSRRTPYKVSIELEPLSDAQWETALDALAEQALFAAQLLNEEMPQDVERVFEQVNASLFPVAGGDLVTHCSCPDPANPCKHIAAVYFLLGEQFDADPFLLFELRGRDKAAITAGLRKRRVAGETIPEPVSYAPDAIAPVTVSPLSECLAHYWEEGGQSSEIAIAVAAPAVELALLKRVGLPDFLEAESFREQMERLYTGVTERALAAAFADSG